jgi:hypothetical protein
MNNIKGIKGIHTKKREHIASNLAREFSQACLQKRQKVGPASEDPKRVITMWPLGVPLL